MKIFKLTSLVFLLLQAVVATANAESFFSYEGQLLDSNEAPITASTTMSFSVVSGSTCVLYTEQQSVTPTTHGDFSVAVGTGTRSDATGNTVTQIFSKNASAALCADGVTAHDPAAVRYLRVSINGEVLTPDARISAVPYAFQADRLQSKSAADFLNINTTQGLTQTNAESVFSRFTKLDAILNGFNSAGTSLSANITGNAATATTATTANNISGVVALSNGGTAATSAAGARTNLGLGPLAVMSPSGTADNTTFLRGDGSWAVVPVGSGGAVTSVAGHTGVVVLGTADLTDYTAATTSLVSSVITTKKDVASGIAGLDATAKIPAALLPNSAYFTNDVKAGTLKLAGPSASEITLSAPVVGVSSYNITLPMNAASAVGQILKVSAVSGSDVSLNWAADTMGGAGSGISNIGLSLPTSVFTNGPNLTADGNLGATLQTQAAKAVFAGPATGVAAAPTFRALTADDIPNLTPSKITGLGSVATLSTTGSTTSYLRADGTWAAVAGGSTFTGNLGGDVVGTQLTTTVEALQGRPISTAAPTTNQVLQWTAGQWNPTSLSLPTLSGVLNVSQGGTGTANGSITGTSGLAFSAGGTNQNIALMPSGTGTVGIYGSSASFTISPTTSTYLDVRGLDTVVQIAKTKSKIVGGYASGGAIYLGNGQSEAGGETATGAIETSWDSGNPKIGIGVVRDNSGARITMDQVGVTSFEHKSSGTSVVLMKLTPTLGGTLDITGCAKVGGTPIGGVCASDQRLKKDVHEFDLGMDVLLGLRPKFYRYNGLGGVLENEKPILGVIAQELELVAPSLVEKTKVKLHPDDTEMTEIKQVNYSSFTYVIINAVKELYQKWFDDSQQIHLELKTLQQENFQMKKWICQQDSSAPFCAEK